MKKQIAGLLTGFMICSALLSGCGKNEATQAAKESVETEKEGTGDIVEDEKKSDSKDTKGDSDEEKQEEEQVLDKVGVLLPEEGTDINSTLERTELKERLEEAGYEAALYFADEDADTQISQIRELLGEEKLKALILSPVDPYSLGDVLEEVSEQSIPVFAYDNLIMDTDKIKYFISFNTRAVGKEIGKNIVKQAELDKVRDAKESRTIEFFMGSPDDEAALFFYNGILEALQEYLDDGTLICRSQKLTFDENAIMDENPDTAVKAFQDITEEFYLQEKTPDIICTASDAYAMAVLEELEKEEISPEDESWPLITGCGADADAVKSVAEGKLEFTMMMDRRDLAEACITFVTTYLKGDDVEVSNYSQYDNGKKLIGTVTCDGKIIDKDNYQILVDNGFYQAEMIAPEATPTPAPEEVSPTPQASLTPEATKAPSGTPGPEITTEEVPEVGDKEEAAA